MFDRTGASVQKGPHTKPPFLTLSLILTNSDPNLNPNTRWRLTASPNSSPSQHTLSCQISSARGSRKLHKGWTQNIPGFYRLAVARVCVHQIWGRSFVRSLLRAGVQPTLDPSAETFMSVQCTSPGRGEELVGVCGVCASCVGWRKGWVGVSSLSGISKRAPSRRGLMSG